MQRRQGMMKVKTSRGTLTIEALKKFCDSHAILVPSGATKAVYEATIARAGMHLHNIRVDEKIGCFGFWISDDMVCALCRYEEICQKTSLGTKVTNFERAFENAGVIKMEFSEKITRKR